MKLQHLAVIAAAALTLGSEAAFARQFVGGTVYRTTPNGVYLNTGNGVTFVPNNAATFQIGNTVVALPKLTVGRRQRLLQHRLHPQLRTHRILQPASGLGLGSLQQRLAPRPQPLAPAQRPLVSLKNSNRPDPRVRPFLRSRFFGVSRASGR